MPLFTSHQELSLRVQNRNGWVHLRTLIAVRWVGIAGQLGAVLVTQFLLDYTLPLLPVLVTIAASALLNVWALSRLQRGPTINDRVATMYLAFDIVQLAVLLFLTGGLVNPFVMMLLAPLTVGAAVLRRGLAIMLALILVCAATALIYSPHALLWGRSDFPIIFLFGVWMSLVLSTLFIAMYVFSVAAGTAQIASALQEAQLALARSQKIAAVGALAAAAAHELGSPLSTIAVVAKELVNDLPANSPQAEDAALLVSQVDRCRTILADLAQRPDRSREADNRFNTLELLTLLGVVAEPYRNEHLKLDITCADDNQGPEPVIRPQPELMHGLANLVQNAMQFANRKVTLRAAWRPGWLEITVQDDGPGLPPELLDRIGEPYISTREGESGHMGLGIFIAMNLLDKTGGVLRYANLSHGGTAAIATWHDTRKLGIIAA